MTLSNISTVVASAGTGKTTHIVGRIAEEVNSRPPEEIVATTFTVKAADELIERSRARLFKDGAWDPAARLLGARFGTINSVCGQIVSEHAIALGRSPRADVIPEEGVARIFMTAANAAIERHAPVLNTLADAMGALEPKRNALDAERSDWRTIVRRIIELARSNGIDADNLAYSANKSWETFAALLRPPATSTADLDAALFDAIGVALNEVPDNLSATAKKSVLDMRRVHRAAARGQRISWPDWARLSKVVCAKKDGQGFVSALEAVSHAASRHVEHPRLHEECELFIRTLFTCAGEALVAYQRYKAERGLLDFIDQEALALDVLRDPELSARLAERIDCVFVDEFQDSSPLQIAIFTALAPLVQSSTWVGDPKQAIYGFRNADSALTQAAFAGVVAANAATAKVLAQSYRSREGIVSLVNAAFTQGFEAMGLPAADHSFTGTARTEYGFVQTPFATWWLEDKLEFQFAALAGQIRDILANGGEWRVAGKDGAIRPLEPGDIAILCRTKSDIARIAAALSKLGVKVAVEREGLSTTPHVELAMAAFRWVADPTDGLALAELARFFDDDPGAANWLEAASAEDQHAALKLLVPIAPALEALRAGQLSLTPAELLDAILLLPQMSRRFERWGDLTVCLDDLEALRGFARSYEGNCASSGSPATLSGLILSLRQAKPARPKSLQADAVNVMTYHGAKGLEWPLVVLASLAWDSKARLFEPVAEAEGLLDWSQPLAGRWVRFWPWPYGSQEKDVHLDATASAAALGQAAVRAARNEDIRLLYVGATRARDYLVFAPSVKSGAKWLALLDTATPGHVTLPAADGNDLNAGGTAFACRTLTLAVDDAPAEPVIAPSHVGPERPAVARAPLFRQPSHEAGDIAYRVVERVELGPRLPLVGQPDMAQLGEAVHAIFAADDRAAERPARLARALSILQRWNVHEVKADDVLSACDRLHDHFEARWPGARMRREIPIHARVGEQLISGRIDLLVEHAAGLAIVDHKSFPGSRDNWDAKAVGYGPQLGLYAEAARLAVDHGNCDHLFVHMPIVGALLRLEPEPRAA
ncbi:MAG: UvrD-helicase domain-containing protein [Sphingomonadales bacterium]|nr:UvrD-helicase domain-containing protein [Sphingomonadales bacterium]